MAAQSSRRAGRIWMAGGDIDWLEPWPHASQPRPGRPDVAESAVMTRDQLVSFIRKHRWGVEASVAAGGHPQAAVVGVAVTDALELVFDTLDSTRKCANLRRDPRVAFVIGWDEACTVQYEGIADEPTGPELARLQEIYFAHFPD